MYELFLNKTFTSNLLLQREFFPFAHLKQGVHVVERCDFADLFLQVQLVFSISLARGGIFLINSAALS